MRGRAPWPRRTERLELREMLLEDVPRIVEIRQLPGVDHWLLHDSVDPHAYAEQLQAEIAEPGTHEIVATYAGVVIAHAGITVLPPRAQVSTSSARAEGGIGYVLDPAHAGHGFATEIAGELLRVAFEDLELRRVVSDTFADNVASWRVLEKIGMRREKHARRSASWAGSMSSSTRSSARSGWSAAGHEPAAGRAEQFPCDARHVFPAVADAGSGSSRAGMEIR